MAITLQPEIIRQLYKVSVGAHIICGNCGTKQAMFDEFARRVCSLRALSANALLQPRVPENALEVAQTDVLRADW